VRKYMGSKRIKNDIVDIKKKKSARGFEKRKE
jgi:hypothetical protein